MDAPVIDSGTRSLAEKIYSGLLQGSVTVSATGVQVTADPKDFAKVSFKLALAFRAVENELNAESLPKNQDFTLELSDLNAWSKK
jgi:hypothetical protein